MANAGEEDLMGLGSHCEVADCQQLDFLPFKCDCCKKTFCLDHRTYSAHACTKAANRSLEIIVCPVCATSVHLKPGEDPNAAFERHTRAGCDPSNYARVHKKPKCPLPGCKEKLTSVNTYCCKDCGRKVCLKHRFPEDHQCPGKAAPPPSSRLLQGSSLQGLGSRAATLMGGISRSAAAAASSAAASASSAAAATRARAAAVYADPANSVRGTAERRRAHLGLPARTSGPAAAAAGPEVCPQCGLGFSSVQDLIRHVDLSHTQPSHSAGAAGARSQQQQQQRAGGEAYRCHRCGSLFSDPLALVDHDGRCSAAAATRGMAGRTAAAGGGSEQERCVLS